MNIKDETQRQATNNYKRMIRRTDRSDNRIYSRTLSSFTSMTFHLTTEEQYEAHFTMSRKNKKCAGYSTKKSSNPYKI